MFKLRAKGGKMNLCGEVIASLRNEHTPPLSQRALAKMLQVAGYDIDHFTIRKIENRTRFVTDIELRAFSTVLGVPIEFFGPKRRNARIEDIKC